MVFEFIGFGFVSKDSVVISQFLCLILYETDQFSYTDILRSTSTENATICFIFYDQKRRDQNVEADQKDFNFSKYGSVGRRIT